MSIRSLFWCLINKGPYVQKVTQVCIRSGPAVHRPHIAFCFFVCPSPFLLYHFLTKPKSFHMSGLKLAGASAIQQTLSLSSPSTLAASATFALPLVLYKRAEHKGWWERMVTFHFLLLYCSWQRSQHFWPGRPFEDRLKPSHPREHCNTFVTAVLQKDPATSLFNNKNVWSIFPDFLTATCGYLLAGLPQK